MANISSAFGDITIEVEGEKALKDFTYLFDKVLGIENACYYTATNGWKYQDGEANATFDGCGRWVYENNAEMTYEWIKNGIEALKDEDEKKQLQEIWASLNEKDWQIIYDFSDEECGCECLYQMECMVEHKAYDSEASYSVISHTYYDYTPDNLVELGYCDSLEEAKDYMGIED